MADIPEEKQTAETNDAPEPTEELVKVFDTEQESEAMVVRGLLESAGIPAVIQNLDAPQDVLPGVGGVVVLVREEQAEDALAVIQQGRESEESDTSLSEEQV